MTRRPVVFPPGVRVTTVWHILKPDVRRAVLAIVQAEADAVAEAAARHRRHIVSDPADVIEARCRALVAEAKAPPRPARRLPGPPRPRRWVTYRASTDTAALVDAMTRDGIPAVEQARRLNRSLKGVYSALSLAGRPDLARPFGRAATAAQRARNTTTTRKAP